MKKVALIALAAVLMPAAMMLEASRNCGPCKKTCKTSCNTGCNKRKSCC